MNLEQGDNPRSNTASRQEIFYGNGGTYSVWSALPHETMAFMICIGGGGGGGGGFTAAAGTVRGGGGGGGSGAMARALVPLCFLPRTLYVKVGIGGNGGAASTIGTAGDFSYINIDKTDLTASRVLRSGSAVAAGGAAGSAAGSAAGGAAETIMTAASSLWSQVGVSSFIAGKIGAAGGVVGGGAGSNNSILTASIMNGGAGGGTTPAANTNFAGGTQANAGNVFPQIVGGVGGGNPGHGSGGYSYNGIFAGILGYGGAGGGTGGAAGTVGGRGGDGACPGGGGGGGGGGVTGGAGGRGGDGMVMIISW